MIESSRRLWNLALNHRKRCWEERRVSVSYTQQCKLLTAERRDDPLINELYSQAAQDILRRLERAFGAFFAHKARFPRFKKFSEVGSFTYPQAYGGSVKPNSARKRLFLSKVGNVKVIFHRKLPPTERLKTCTVVRQANGEWYACLIYETENLALQKGPPFASPVGIDLGLKSLVATTQGVKVPHPQFLRRAERRLKLTHRQFSRARKGSKNRERARRLFAIQSAKVSRQRKDFNHKLSTELVSEHDLVVLRI